MKKKLFTALGLMTGTSMDGIDLSIIKTDGYSHFSPILDIFYEFEDELQTKLINLREKIFTVGDLTKYSNEIDNIEKEFTLFHCEAMKSVIEKYNDKIDLIGFHGQTIFHNSKKSISKQIGDGKLLSQITKKIVVNNFREKDIINGGQGAPLTPIFHKVLAGLINKNYEVKFPFNIVNIGGITNITQIIDDNIFEDKNFFAYDIAPGNCLIDMWVRKNSIKKFDENGQLSKSGKVNDLIFNQSIENFSNDYFERSLDINDFDISFVKGLSLEDGCATLTKFTAHLIAHGIIKINEKNGFSTTNNFVCGGGRKNNFLINSINDYLIEKNLQLKNIDDFGQKGDFIESQTFAYLSVRTYLNLPISFPNTTRCNNPTVGGNIIENF